MAGLSGDSIQTVANRVIKKNCRFLGFASNWRVRDWCCCFATASLSWESCGSPRCRPWDAFCAQNHGACHEVPGKFEMKLIVTRVEMYPYCILLCCVEFHMLLKSLSYENHSKGFDNEQLNDWLFSKKVAATNKLIREFRIVCWVLRSQLLCRMCHGLLRLASANRSLHGCHSASICFHCRMSHPPKMSSGSFVLLRILESWNSSATIQVKYPQRIGDYLPPWGYTGGDICRGPVWDLRHHHQHF